MSDWFMRSDLKCGNAWEVPAAVMRDFAEWTLLRDYAAANSDRVLNAPPVPKNLTKPPTKKLVGS